MKQDEENDWGSPLPRSAIDRSSTVGEKDKRVVFARDKVYNKCLDLLDEGYKMEPKWNSIWAGLFTHVMIEERSL